MENKHGNYYLGFRVQGNGSGFVGSNVISMQGTNGSEAHHNINMSEWFFVLSCRILIIKGPKQPGEPSQSKPPKQFGGPFLPT